MRTKRLHSKAPFLSALGSAAALLLGACSSPPPEVEAPPRVPVLEHASPAPLAPLAPERPSLTPVAAPEPPAIWSQDVADVFGESYSLDAVPAALPIDPANVIVTSVPEHTDSELRTALLGGFLSSGYLVKDAGVIGASTFRVDPTVGLTGGFERSVPVDSPESAVTSMTGEQVATSRTYSGLEAMTLEFTDPTSLWVPDLLANENLDADYFLRVFELSVDDDVVQVPLAAVYDPDEVSLYRAEVDRANREVKSYNQSIARFASELAEYGQAYAAYEVAYEKWLERDRGDHEIRAQRYELDWKSWKASQANAIDKLAESGPIEASWKRSEPVPSYQAPTAKAAPEPLVLPEPLASFSTQALDSALDYESEAAVPCRRVRVLAEVVEASSGLVVWVGEVNGVAPLDVPRTEALRRAVRYMAKR